MRKRIYWKIYNRANKKLLACRLPDDRKSTLDIEREDRSKPKSKRILSGIERKIWLQVQAYYISLVDDILKEIEAENYYA